MSIPRGWHGRGYLPHADVPRSHAITYRLADALPATVIQAMRDELSGQPDPEPELRRRIDLWCDRGHGACILQRPDVAELILANWRHFDGERYRLAACVVMPNHVHVLIDLEPQASLSTIVGSWKSYTAKRIATICDLSPPVWQPDYWDRFIRDDEHRFRTVEYIRNNPVRAGLCRAPEDWPWSSAH